MVAENPGILPPNALGGRSLGISASESPDLQRLGLFEDHFRLALGEIARTILFAGGQIFYGGHLREDGYTQFLINELQRYGHRDAPLKVCLSHSEHQRMSNAEIEAQREHIGLFGEIIFLDPSGSPMQFAALDDPSEFKPTEDELAASLTGLRRFLVSATDARVVIGGKRSGFLGRFPGIIEEVLVSVEAAKPVYLAGGFGGATLDAIGALVPENSAWFPRYEEERDDADKLNAGLQALREANVKSQALSMNGLSEEQNQRLAATYRPSEIAALVGYGLANVNRSA